MDDVSEFEAYNLMTQSSNHDIMRNLLFKSLKREKELRRSLNEQIIKNEKLQMELEIEKRKTVIKVESSSDESENCLEKNHIEASQAYEGDLKETFGTNSSILMQYKYDDVCKSYSKCIKKIGKKSKQLKKVLQEAEFQRFLNIQLRDSNIKLHEKIEQLCHRYLTLLEKRNEEKRLLKLQNKELEAKLIQNEFENEEMHH